MLGSCFHCVAFLLPCLGRMGRGLCVNAHDMREKETVEKRREITWFVLLHDQCASLGPRRAGANTPHHYCPPYR